MPDHDVTECTTTWANSMLISGRSTCQNVSEDLVRSEWTLVEASEINFAGLDPMDSNFDWKHNGLSGSIGCRGWYRGSSLGRKLGYCHIPAMMESGKRLNGRIDGTIVSQSSCTLVFHTLIRSFADVVGDIATGRALYSSSIHNRLSHLAMTAIRTFIFFLFSLSITLALPSNLEKPPQAIEAVNSTAPAASLTAPNPFRAYDVECLHTRITPTLIPLDCSYVLNGLILTQPNVFRERRFQSKSYETDGGSYAPSQWHYDTCEVTVVGHRQATTLLTFVVMYEYFGCIQHLQFGKSAREFWVAGCAPGTLGCRMQHPISANSIRYRVCLRVMHPSKIFKVQVLGNDGRPLGVHLSTSFRIRPRN